MSCEVEARRGRYLRAQLQLPHLPFVKTRELCSLRLGYLPLDGLETTMLFQLISGRYERGRILMTIEQELR